MNVSVQLDDSFAAGARMKSVDVLSYEQKFRHALFHFRQSQMCRVWFGFERLLPPPLVPILNKFWIPLKGIGSGELFRFKFAPEPGLRVAKSSEAALGRNSSASQGDDSSSI